MTTPETQQSERPTGIEAMVCADIARRQAVGIRKYGQTVAENPATLKEWLQNLYEEQLDSVIYARRAIEEVATSIWQPIETAPKDGTQIFAYVTNRPPCRAMQVIEYLPYDPDDRRSNQWYAGPFPLHDKPTHWMPLPKAPTE